MSAYMLWFVLGFLLVIAELLSGTFYLLVLAIACGAAGLAALAGAGSALCLVVAAGLGLVGSIGLRRSRFGRALHAKGSQAVQNLDVGATVKVDRWQANRTARAQYRGAEWDVELAPGDEPTVGEFVIREIKGIRLIVSPSKAI